MARGKYLGKTEEKVLGYLWKNPSLNMTEIQEGLNRKSHSPVQKAVHSLVKKEYVVSVGSYISPKGQKVQKWGLTDAGMAFFSQKEDFSIETMKKHSKYKNRYAKIMVGLYNVMQKHSFPNIDETIRLYMKVIGALFEKGIDPVTVTETLQGSLKEKMAGWSKRKIDKFVSDLQDLFDGIEDEVKDMGLSRVLKK